MKLPTPTCPACHHRTLDGGQVFSCERDCDAEFPLPEEWYRDLAADWGQMATEESPRMAGVFARWAARAAMRAVPGLRP